LLPISELKRQDERAGETKAEKDKVKLGDLLLFDFLGILRIRICLSGFEADLTRTQKSLPQAGDISGQSICMVNQYLCAVVLSQGL
jgi:hypothetical protein